MDMVTTVLDALNDDDAITDIVGGGVYGWLIPEGATPPLVCVRLTQSVPVTDPQTVWWRGMLAIDIHSEEMAQSTELAALVQAVAPTIVGTYATCVVADCQVESTQPVVDDGWTPTRFRQIVSVDVTAREP